MAIFSGVKKKSLLKTAIKQTIKARKNQGAKADQLYLSAYEAYANVVNDDLTLGEALYNWGFALYHQAKTKQDNEATLIYKDAIEKYQFCQLISPNHLGAAIDGGVAIMELARIENADPNAELYDLAKINFDIAEKIQRGSAAYNLACIYALRNQENECQKALELSNECGSMPDVESMINDIDLSKITNTSWFSEFIESINAVVELEQEDVSQDGNEKQQPDTEVEESAKIESKTNEKFESLQFSANNSEINSSNIQ